MIFFPSCKTRACFFQWSVITLAVISPIACDSAKKEATPSHARLDGVDVSEHQPASISDKQPNTKFSTAKDRSESDPVAVELVVILGNGENQDSIELSVTLDVDPSYEIASPSASLPKMPTRLSLNLPEGFEASETWIFPETVSSMHPGGGDVLRGINSFKRSIQALENVRDGDHIIECTVEYQACDDRRCLRPMEQKLAVRIPLSRGKPLSD